MATYRQIVLASRPAGEPVPENFRLHSVEIPALQDGQVLVRNHFLSLDPYMRGRMSEEKSYAAPLAVGALMVGETAGEVVESKNPQFKAGDKVVGYLGWLKWACPAAKACARWTPRTYRCRPGWARSACRA